MTNWQKHVYHSITILLIFILLQSTANGCLLKRWGGCLEWPEEKHTWKPAWRLVWLNPHSSTLVIIKSKKQKSLKRILILIWQLIQNMCVYHKLQAKQFKFHSYHCLMVSVCCFKKNFPLKVYSCLHYLIKISCCCFLLCFILFQNASSQLCRGRSQELCESWGGCPGLPIPNSPYTASVDVKQHWSQLCFRFFWW